MSSYTDMQSQSKNPMRQAEDLPATVYFGGVVASIVLSAALFIMGRRNLGIFVGLWPPTILNMALFNKQLRPSQELERGMGSQIDRAA